ncbi:hypothetical protein IGI04_006840 [Brassica rapa subsp. trilocularis]|uniref:Uncharacterized protein n=1 Tax=Brassica rapa subsp. trilocularis TaxID=1813537 RepID=A0ABQ7NI09_BRACM|nr:hypothetical protein IGI04_006840 [Brassica rapa subsp. trilocularis]
MSSYQANVPSKKWVSSDLYWAILIIDFYETIITVAGVTNASHSATSHNVINRFFPGWMV